MYQKGRRGKEEGGKKKEEKWNDGILEKWNAPVVGQKGGRVTDSEHRPSTSVF